MKRILAIALLISAVSAQAMDKQPKKEGQIEGQVQKAAEAIAKEEKKKSANEQLAEATSAFWSALCDKGTEFKKKATDVYTEWQNDDMKCNVTEYKEAAKEKAVTAWQSLGAWLSKEEEKQVVVQIPLFVPQPVVVQPAPQADTKNLSVDGLNPEQVNFLETLRDQMKKNEIH